MSKSEFLSLVNQGTFLFDGAIGTELQARGLPVGEVPEKWNFSNPDALADIHKKYAEAGARAVTTNSFGGSPHKLKSCSLQDKAYEVNKVAVEIARKAVGDSILVAGSVGPTGALLMMGDLSESEMASGFEIQIKGLVDGGADLIILETFSDPDEIKIALQAAKAVTDLPVITSMTFEPGAKGFRTMMGTDIPTAVKMLEDAGADILATNCGTGIDKAVEIVAEMRQNTSMLICAEPNAGLPKLVNGQTTYLETPEQMAARIPDLINAGAQIVGGCCGTTPAHIKLFSEVIARL